jgi:hypothetical protein
MYEALNGAPLAPAVYNGSGPRVDCHNGGSWVFHGLTGFGGLTFTPNFEVYVECEEETTRAGETSSIGAGRVYVRAHAADSAARAESPLGLAVECDEVVERTLRRRNSDDEWIEAVERRKVAYVPVEDPTGVAITSCGYHSNFDGANLASSADCDTSLQAQLTPDFEVIVECETETTYPVGWSSLPQGGVLVTGYEHVYLHVGSTESDDVPENPLGLLVECDETYEWEFSSGTDSARQYRESVAYLPVADPTSVRLTRCDESDGCVVSERVSFTDDFDVYVRCELEITGSSPFSSSHDAIYYRVD